MATSTSVAVLTPEEVRTAVREEVQAVLKEVLPQVIRQAIEKPYLTKSELQQLTGWSSRQIEYKKSRREIPFVKRGRLVLFPTEDVFAYLEEGRVPAKSVKQ